MFYTLLALSAIHEGAQACINLAAATVDDDSGGNYCSSNCRRDCYRRSADRTCGPLNCGRSQAVESRRDEWRKVDVFRRIAETAEEWRLDTNLRGGRIRKSCAQTQGLEDFETAVMISASRGLQACQQKQRLRFNCSFVHVS